MNRIARTLAALLVAAGLTTAVAVNAHADASHGTVVAGNGHWPVHFGRLPALGPG